ncbi:MAG: diacylglycerol kinase family lipid kinase [Verrucomicrobia bacterium]|nr:diacylglycerol kinase family lipid kinase [Verrucomicrobiota bacterium]
MMRKRIGFIVNPVAGAGRGQARWTGLRDQFRQDGVPEKLLFTARPGDAVRLAHDLNRECDVVVAVGGDGTLFEVASGLLLSGATNTLLGVIPLGTGNDTARLCGINDAEQARLALRGERTKALDVIRIQCQGRGMSVTRHALLYGGVGIVGEVVKRTTPRVKRIFGQRLAYPVGALRAIWSCTAPRMRVTCDGQTWENRFLLVCASNGELSGGGIRLSPGARMDDGLLNVNVCETVGRWAAVGLLWRVCRGRHVTHRKVRYLTARTLMVEPDLPLDVEADGEFVGHTPVHFEAVPRTLRVLIP